MDNSSEWVEITLWQAIDVIDAGPDKVFYSFEYIDTLHALTPVLGTGLWTTISSPGVPSFDDETLSNTVVRNMGPGQNTFEWTVSNGACVKKDQVTIDIIDILIPEGFSPNGDGINDFFEIKGLDTLNNTGKLVVINAYGSQVYKNDDYEGLWDGLDQDGNELPEGTYYYLFTIQSERIDKTKPLSGFIILNR